MSRFGLARSRNEDGKPLLYRGDDRVAKSPKSPQETMP